MAAINELISRIQDPELRASIQAEVDKLSRQKKFGLVFEDHIPECTPLYELPIRVGTMVARKSGSINDLMLVATINGDSATCLQQGDGASVEVPLTELVAAARFGEPIYPYLKPIDAVCNAPDSDLWHTLIEADNYHALQLLEYLYAGKVDCIYIDPPYNTGAKDWKYNNDYVDGSDAYRHSKWLSFMEKRLRLAKKLLNPKDSVLIVTIDEKEYLHLGCLLEEIYSGDTIQMVTALTNKKGQPRSGIFSRCEEYIFCVFIGSATVNRTDDNMLFAEADGNSSESPKLPTIWNSLLRRGTHAAREDRPKLFYPIFIDSQKSCIHSVGDPIDIKIDRHSVIAPPGCEIAWPLHKDGSEGNWQMKPETLRTSLSEGVAKLGRKDAKSGTWSIVYLKRKQLQQAKSGELITEGRDQNGALILRYPGQNDESTITLLQEPRSLWVRDRHDASVYGSTMIKSIIRDHSFAFPKSLYAVQDTIRFFVANKPNALIIDFFAGSGTTLHAVNLLNAEDSGQRRCILVTNNEVNDPKDREFLSAKGFKPGDPEWEKLGIAHYVTWPRTVCSIEGHDVNGNPLKGSYIGSDRPMSEGFKANAAFFKLGFLDKASVRVGRQFREMLPTLWMKAGCHGPCPTCDEGAVPDMLILPQNHMAVLNDNSSYAAFAERVEQEPQIDTVYLVTDSDADYRSMAKGLSAPHKYQLYRDYLDNFRINSKR